MDFRAKGGTRRASLDAFLTLHQVKETKIPKRREGRVGEWESGGVANKSPYTKKRTKTKAKEVFQLQEQIRALILVNEQLKDKKIERSRRRKQRLRKEDEANGGGLETWERAYADDRSWESLQEDESGLLRPIDNKAIYITLSIVVAFVLLHPLLAFRKDSFAISTSSSISPGQLQKWISSLVGWQ